jgi:hypothetical protein
MEILLWAFILIGNAAAIIVLSELTKRWNFGHGVTLAFAR